MFGLVFTVQSTGLSTVGKCLNVAQTATDKRLYLYCQPLEPCVVSCIVCSGCGVTVFKDIFNDMIVKGGF